MTRKMLQQIGLLGLIHQRLPIIYRSGAEDAALKWIAAYPEPDENVLASFEAVNPMPSRTDLRLFASHRPLTGAQILCTCYHSTRSIRQRYLLADPVSTKAP